MIIDHFKYLFLEPTSFLFYALAIISRYTFIIFNYLLVLGFTKTKNIKKYIMRLLIFGIISQPFFTFFSTGYFFKVHTFNIMITMTLTLVSLSIYTKEKDWFIKYSYILCLYLLTLLCDWGFVFIPVALVMYKYKDNNKLRNLLLIIIFIFYLLFQENKIIYLGFSIQLMLISIVDINKKNKFSLKYFAYAFYPLHLLILRIIFLFLNA